MALGLKRGLVRISRRLAAPLAPSMTSVRTDARAMALTFDDGPDPEWTPRLLDLLARLDARATFFVIGERAARRPDLVARIVSEGHALGSHTWSHPSLPRLSPDRVEDEIRRGRDQLPAQAEPLFRPPFGDQSFATARIARRLGVRIVLWSAMAEDWRDDSAEVMADRVIRAAAPGAIVLMHDSLFAYDDRRFRDRTAAFETVERVVAALPDYRFVTVPALLRLGTPVETMWLKSSDPAQHAALAWADS
jgi:peptidoglycan/xylan/chitin deacetylase (PgdA/CDA1 family)